MKCLFYLVAMGIMGNKLMNEVKVRRRAEEKKVDYKGIGNEDIKITEQFNIQIPHFIHEEVVGK